MKYLIFTNHSHMLWKYRRELISALSNIAEIVLCMPLVEKEDSQQKYRCIEVEIDRRGVNPIKDYKLLRHYKKIVAQEKPDMVLTYSIKPNIYAGYVSRLLKIPYCAHVQGLGSAFESKILSNIVTLMYKIALRNVKTVFFENYDNANEFIKRKIIPQEKATVLTGAGVNLEQFSKESYPSEENGIRFLYVGRIMREKGMDEFLFAAKKLKEKYGEKVLFDIIGYFEEEYKSTIEKLNQEKIINFYGFQDDTIPFYKNAHCLVLPSYHEGMSNVLLEAAATGRALITTDIPGCREAVDDGVNGYLCKSKDAEDLYRVMEKYIALTPEQRENMGKQGRVKMEKCFDRNVVVEKTIEKIIG